MPHVDWRLIIFANNGSSLYTGLYELQMYDIFGNLLTTGGSASTSSNAAGTTGANVFDGNFTTFWVHSGQATFAAPAWVNYTFTGSGVDVAVVRISALPSGTGTGGAEPTQFKMQWSDDGSTWNDATGVIAPLGWGSEMPCWSLVIPAAAIPGGSFVNWRMRIITGNGSYYDATEIQFKEVQGGPTITTTNVQYAIQNPTHNFPGVVGGAFDGNLTTMGSIFPNTNAWFGYAFNKPRRVIEVDYTNGYTTNWVASSPTKIALEGSNDCGATWTTVQTFNADPWTGPSQTQIFGVTPDQRDNLHYNQVRAADRNGSGNQFQMFGGGPVTQGNVAAFDAQGNIVDPNLGQAVGRNPGIPPASSSAGTPGQFAMDGAGNLYWCYAANLWKKVTGTSF